MNRSEPPLNEKELLSRLKAGNRLAFSELYDRYASTLLGVITRIIKNEAEAIEALEKTFIAIRSQADQFQTTQQPLFVWLLGIARSVASDTLKKRSARKALPNHLTLSDQLVVTKPPTVQITIPPNTPTNFPLHDLLNAVVFKNCTPEEAAASLGIPAEAARQQLRLAYSKFGLYKAPVH